MRFKVLATLVCLAGATACTGSSKYQVTGSAGAPDADGRITVAKVEGGNSMVTLQMEHLAPPARMNNAATAYVVWFEKRGAPPARAGQLTYDESARTGTMRATTTDRQFDVVVTAEAAPVVATPGSVVVFQKQVDVP
jgi:hypothetical protein